MFTVAQARWSAQEIYLFVAAFGAMGHHLPGMIRAYGDRSLFERFKWRFILAPIFLLAICVGFYFWDIKSNPVVMIVFAFTYLSLSRNFPDSFSERLDHVGAMYFTLQDFAARPGWGGGNPWPDPPWVQKGLFTVTGAPKPALSVVSSIYHSTVQIAPERRLAR